MNQIETILPLSQLSPIPRSFHAMSQYFIKGGYTEINVQNKNFRVITHSEKNMFWGDLVK